MDIKPAIVKLHTPWKSSGAAYGGLPQNVSSLLPNVNSLLNPKSAIFMFRSASSSKFSACTNNQRPHYETSFI